MKLRLILGDQLNTSISSLRDCKIGEDVVCLFEVAEEAKYVKHHKKKIAFIFSAMRHFAKELSEQGYEVHYVQLDNTQNTGSFCGELDRAIEAFEPEEVIVTEPSEYRVEQMLTERKFAVPVQIVVDDRFYCLRDEFIEWVGDKKQLRMEFFYREMRKRHNILMDGSKPEGEKWNFDAENRSPPKKGLSIPASYSTKPDSITSEVIDLVHEKFGDHFGDLEPFYFAVTRGQALNALRLFIDERLAKFGTYQDAMIEGEPWMFHSHISFYLNIGLLLPHECVDAAVQAYRDDAAPLNAVEGFVRQILGWREFVRGIYWLKMPEYETQNFLNASRALPEFFWTADTNMNCLKQCIEETRQNAYAHHIQRLMVLGNFALLAGLDPEEVNDWYLLVYADAFQWVELPNVTGMILFADGGFLGSKPYAASGAYINKMSNYCKNCDYAVKEKNGETACPFNYLYWDFLTRHRDQLGTNQRLAMIYKTLDKMSDDKRDLIASDSKRFFGLLENEKV